MPQFCNFFAFASESARLGYAFQISLWISGGKLMPATINPAPLIRWFTQGFLSIDADSRQKKAPDRAEDLLSKTITEIKIMEKDNYRKAGGGK